MTYLKGFAKIQEVAPSLLSGEYLESFSQIFGFFILISLTIVLLDIFRRIPFVSWIIRRVSAEADREYEDSYMVLLLRTALKRKVRWFLFFASLTMALILAYAAFQWGSLAILALISNSLAINRFTAFLVLFGISAVHLYFLWFMINDAHKVAKYIRINHA